MCINVFMYSSRFHVILTWFLFVWEFRSALVNVFNSTRLEEGGNGKKPRWIFRFESCDDVRGEGKMFDDNSGRGYRSWRTYMDGFRSNRSMSFSKSFSCFSSAVFRFTFGTVSVSTGSNRNSLWSSARLAFSPCRQNRGLPGIIYVGEEGRNGSRKTDPEARALPPPPSVLRSTITIIYYDSILKRSRMSLYIRSSINCVERRERPNTLKNLLKKKNAVQIVSE